MREREGRAGGQTGIFKVRLGLGETEIQRDRETKLGSPTSIE